MGNIFFELVPAKGHGISAVEAAMQLAQMIRQKILSPAVRIRIQKAAKVIIDKSDLLRSAADRHHCIVAVVRSKGDEIDTADDMGDLDDSPWANGITIELASGEVFGRGGGGEVPNWSHR